MSIIAPPAVDRKRHDTNKEDKAYFSKVLTAKVREMILTEDGRQMTIAQAGAERLASIMLYAESNQDAIAAAKVIFDRVEGKPRVVKDDESRPMPRITIKLNNEQYKKGVALAEEDNDAFDEGEEKVVFKFDSGEEYEG